MSSTDQAYWEFNNSSYPWSRNRADARWEKYRDLDNLRIEQAYNNNESIVHIGKYYVELSSDRMVQVNDLSLIVALHITN